MTTIQIAKNVMVPMRDSISLATDIYRLEGSDPGPALVSRTPYDKNHSISGSSNSFDIIRAVHAGYTVVIQDVRGRYASEGDFNPHFQETDDGLDTFAWVAAQPWCNGNIGTFGGSYLGGTQWLPARENPRSLRAMAPSITFSDYDHSLFQCGAKVLHDLRWVVANIVPAEIERRRARGEEILEVDKPLDVDGAFSEIPLAKHPYIKEYASFYLDWLAHPTDDPYWEGISPKIGHDKISVPAMNISGWYDIFLWSTFDNFNGMRKKGSSEQIRKNQRVIIGPWTHMNFSGSFPEREFGPKASSHAIDLPGMHLRWFDRWVKGIENGVEDEPSVLLFVMGADEWREAQEWPLPDTKYCEYYLHSNGEANSLHGDGELSTIKPENEPADIYLYNPLRPVPTIGGQVILPGANSMGPKDQREAELRDDVLVYSTPVLQEPVQVIGPISLRLFASSSALDTDFTGKLVDVFPDGRAIILTEGILRARYRNSLKTAELLKPDEIYELALDLWATANVFLPGHQIRLEVSSSNFPRFDRNSNSGGDISKEDVSEYRPAINRIFHDAAHPSCLVLPIVEM